MKVIPFDAESLEFRLSWTRWIFGRLQEFAVSPKDALVRSKEPLLGPESANDAHQRRIREIISGRMAEFYVAEAMVTQRQVTFAYVVAIAEAIVRSFARSAVQHLSEVRGATDADAQFYGIWCKKWPARLNALFTFLQLPVSTQLGEPLAELNDRRNDILHELSEEDVTAEELNSAFETAYVILAECKRLASAIGMPPALGES